jgi:hypothetical protein
MVRVGPERWVREAVRHTLHCVKHSMKPAECPGVPGLGRCGQLPLKPALHCQPQRCGGSCQTDLSGVGLDIDMQVYCSNLQPWKNTERRRLVLKSQPEVCDSNAGPAPQRRAAVAALARRLAAHCHRLAARAASAGAGAERAPARALAQRCLAEAAACAAALGGTYDTAPLSVLLLQLTAAAATGSNDAQPAAACAGVGAAAGAPGAGVCDTAPEGCPGPDALSGPDAHAAPGNVPGNARAGRGAPGEAAAVRNAAGGHGARAAWAARRATPLALPLRRQLLAVLERAAPERAAG